MHPQPGVMLNVTAFWNVNAVKLATFQWQLVPVSSKLMASMQDLHKHRYVLHPRGLIFSVITV
jgi:hypothetical protein